MKKKKGTKTMNNQVFMFILCAAFILAVIILQAVQIEREKKKNAMKDKIIAGKNDYILRLYSELKKEKGIDKPFMIPLDPAPDFDIAAVFKAAEEAATEEPAAEEAAEEEAEEGNRVIAGTVDALEPTTEGGGSLG
jgi:hypothetical protein